MSDIHQQPDWAQLMHAINQCNWNEYDALSRSVRTNILRGGGYYLIGETALANPLLNNTLLLKATQAHAQSIIQQKGPISHTFIHHPPKQNGRQKIRLGFVGCDFFEQATTYLMMGFLEALDRSQFEIFAYDFGPRAMSPMRERIIKACDQFRTIDQLDDTQAAQLIYDDAIDVLLSIKNPASARLGLFLRRPCAIQIHYLYYPGTSGMPFFDWFIADNIVVPPELENEYAEKILRMACCYQPNDNQRVRPAALTRNDFGIPENAIVLGNFSQTYKITPNVFDTWCALLQADSQRILWLLSSDPAVQHNLRLEAAKRNVAPERLFFSPSSGIEVHYARMRCADLILDTFPYGGHTLTSDALWAGVPVITQSGTTYASRVAASLMIHAGYPELVCHSEEEYLRKAEFWAREHGQRVLLTQRLRQAWQEIDLFKPSNYARCFADAMQFAIHQRWAN